jgi:hypothetical protein
MIYTEVTRIDDLRRKIYVIPTLYLIKVTDDLVEKLDTAEFIDTITTIVIPKCIFCQGCKHHCNCVIFLMVEFFMVSVCIQKPVRCKRTG